MAPQEEITGKRPTNYSLWHRKLPSWCYMTDGDWFEQRVIDGVFRAVGYIEAIQVPIVEGADVSHPVWPSKKSLCLEIERKMSIPVHVVWHNKACNDFLVLRLVDGTLRRMNEDAYTAFIKSLGTS